MVKPFSNDRIGIKAYPNEYDMDENTKWIWFQVNQAMHLVSFKMGPTQ